MDINNTKVAFITGITGQDGSYLAEILLEKNYDVWGMIRKASDINTNRIDHLLNKLNLNYGDMTDYVSIFNILSKINNKYNNLERLEIYNLAAQSHVGISFGLPDYTAQTDAVGTLKLLEAVRNLDFCSKVRFYQASTSELYGKVQEVPQNENTPFYPRSPYGVAKLYSYWIVKNYRESYNMFTCNGILFNHENPRRGFNFVTKKIVMGLKKIINNPNEVLKLGNLNSKRDWGHAKDFCYGMWMILQHNNPDDYVLATNEYHTVKEFVEKAFSLKDLIIEWKGEGVDEKGYDKNTGRLLVEVDSRYLRPAEVDELLGDSSKVKRILGWKHNISFDELVKNMVEYEFSNKL